MSNGEAIMWSDVRFLDVLDIEIVDGEARLKLGDALHGTGMYARGIPLGMTGVVAFPDPFDSTGACQAMSVTTGSENYVWQTWDPRYATKVGNLPAGSRGFVTRGEARFLLNPEKEQISSYTLNGTDRMMMVDLDGSTGVLTLMVHDKFVQIDQATDSIKILCGSNWIELTKDVINMSAPAVNVVGGVDLGGDGTVPGEPVALAPDLLSWVAEVNTWIGAINTILGSSGIPVAGGVAKLPGPPGASPPAAPTASPLASSTVAAAK
ncbi:MAG: hypothetical protein KC731_24430 [Myxococcales bacterium]|nr:hypothetical protein [Myxococcales bacterium]